MEISCAFATGPETPAHVALAEQLGYRRAWLYDSPALYPDVWMSLALAAERTSAIGLATGVLIPRLRHVLVTASAAAHVELLAPGRLTLGIGTGFTGSRALGQKAMRWADVAAYVEALRALLRGETVEWDGAAIRMLHPRGHAPERPLEIPIVIATAGPKGEAVARRLADGVFVAGSAMPEGFDWSVQLAWGTVLDDGEDPTSDRVFDAAGPAAAVAYHGLYEFRGAEAVASLPNGAAWVQRIEAVPEAVRHLAVHDGHLATVNAIDRDVVPRETVEHLTLTGPPAVVRAKLDAIEASGVTELAYQPCGPDIERELETFMSAARRPRG